MPGWWRRVFDVSNNGSFAAAIGHIETRQAHETVARTESPSVPGRIASTFACPHVSHGTARSFWQRLLWTAPCRLARTFTPAHLPVAHVYIGIWCAVQRDAWNIIQLVHARAFLANCNNSRGPSAVCHESHRPTISALCTCARSCVPARGSAGALSAPHTPTHPRTSVLIFVVSQWNNPFAVEECRAKYRSCNVITLYNRSDVTGRWPWQRGCWSRGGGRVSVFLLNNSVFKPRT
jgi:hypothetical protein